MTRIHLAADHGGYELGRALERRAREAAHDAVWHGAGECDKGDDYPVFAFRVARGVVEDQDANLDAFGALVVEEPAAGLIAANKVNGARAIVTGSPAEAIRLRKLTDANVLVLGGEYFELTAWQSLVAFVGAHLDHVVANGRRILQIEEYENAGTIEGWAIQLEPEQIAISYE